MGSSRLVHFTLTVGGAGSKLVSPGAPSAGTGAQELSGTNTCLRPHSGQVESLLWERFLGEFYVPGLKPIIKIMNFVEKI